MKQYNILQVCGRRAMGSSSRRLIGLAMSLAAVAAWAPTAATAEINVVASIKPVHSLVAGVMQGIGEPELLVKSAGSEHGYTVRPSEARSLEQAQVVFWVGQSLETFLVKPLQALAGNAKVVDLSQVPDLTLLAAREAGTWEAGEDGDTHAGADGEGGGALVNNSGAADHAKEYARGRNDMHIWLDPGNAQALTTAVAAALVDSDPPNGPSYQANAERLRQRLGQLDRSLADRLATVADRPFVVFHDAYQYFERRYGLQAVAAITINPTLRPSVRRFQEIQKQVEELGVACVFAEPQFEPALVDALIEGTDVRKGVLDPLGADLEPGPEQYFQLMDRLADSLIDCLGEAE
jgi:zinc transport system substrate-binding protein